PVPPERAEPDRDVDQGLRNAPPGLQEQHTDRGIGREPIREHATRRSRADDHVIVGHRVSLAAGPAPRSLGSSTSRRASPSRLKPSTTMKMARPGKMPAHGAFVICPWAAAVSMPPQLGTSGGTPTPRKLISPGTAIIASTIRCTMRSTRRPAYADTMPTTHHPVTPIKTAPSPTYSEIRAP